MPPFAVIYLAIALGVAIGIWISDYEGAYSLQETAGGALMWPLCVLFILWVKWGERRESKDIERCQQRK